MIFVGLLAGGTGRRFAGSSPDSNDDSLPKQFKNLENKPVFLYSLDALVKNKDVKKIIIACHVNYREFVAQQLDTHFNDPGRFEVVDGGATRGSSLINIFDRVAHYQPTSQCKLLIHEAARPLLTSKTINDHLIALQSADASITLMPAVDLMMVSEDGKTVTSIPPKKNVLHGQCPQGYKARWLLDRMAEEGVRERVAADEDPLAICIAGGCRPTIVAGGRHLNKLTVAADVALALYFLQQLRATGDYDSR